MRSLTDAELDATEQALRGERGDALRRSMFELNLSLPTTSADGIALARDLGWLEDDNQFTELGSLVRDPLREYSLWLERDGKMASGDLVPALQAQNYANKRVIELGSGSGCNLLTLQDQPGRFVGVEPMPNALQMMPVLARLAGIQVPEAVSGTAEDIPFEDDTFDVVLCYSSHQYMDIDVALGEMSRVLDRDGQMIIIGNSLRPFIPETIKRFASGRHLGTLKYDLQAIVNTVAYQLRGKRILKDASGSTTGMPIYPASSYMRKKLDALGFGIDEHLTTQLPSDETALFASRR